jgi:NitT/TauT family transport system substrate-binding protein
MKLLSALFAAAIALGLAAPVARAQDSAPVRVASSPIDAGAEALYAADMGFFTKAGLNVTTQIIPNGNVAIESLLSGAIDVAYVGITNLEIAYKKGLPLVAIAPAGYLDSSKTRVGYLIIRNGVDVKTPKDLEGKTIASFPLKSVGELATNYWIDRNGGDSSKIKYLEVPFAATVGALQQGRVDGAILIDPFATASKSVGYVFGPDPFAAVAPVWLGGAFVTTKAWAAAHPDQVRRFVASIRETADWANKDQGKSALILSKYNQMDVAVINASPRVLYYDSLKPAMIQPTIDLVARYKMIDAPFKAEEIIYQAPR